MAQLSRKQQALHTRKRLREAARHEFASRGVGATSIDHIVAAAGYSRGAFYANYQNKQELLLELIIEKHNSEISIWESLIASSSCLESALDMLESRFSEYAKFSENLRLLAEMEIEVIRNPDFEELYKKHSELVRVRVADLVRKLCRSAGVRLLDEELVSLSLRALSIGTIFGNAHNSSMFSAGKIICFFLRGVFSTGRSS